MKFITTLLIILLSSSAISLFGQECDQEVTEFNTSTINTAISPLDLWWDGSDAIFEYPKDEGVQAIFNGGFWVSGIISNSLYTSNQSYQRSSGGNEFQFNEGPIGALDSLYFCDVFQITRSAVDQHLTDLSDGQLDNPIPEIINWPGRGNANGPSILLDDEFAPFTDLNGNQIYEPEQGEYPSFSGDQAAWWVVNTKDAPYRFSSSWNAELHVLVQSFNQGVTDQLTKTQFFSATLINRDSLPIDSASLTFRIDPDIGCYTDDAIGSIPDLKLMYAYNSDITDGTTGNVCNGGVATYPGVMPVPVTQILSGKTTVADLEPRFGATYTLNASISSPEPQMTAPTQGLDIEFFNLSHGRWKTGLPLPRGGNGFGGLLAS